MLIEWKMRKGGGRGRGVTALFGGDSGTGKTMSAEVIAGELGLDLYTVNLATVVDKYVGETEKNLERIFAEAGGVNAVLLFDEADAIFGKRSEVRDAHDRYANIESAYLLQRMETFDGLAILATNLRSNIDDAFTRRLDMIIDFPAPDETSRLAIWQQCLKPPAPSRARSRPGILCQGVHPVGREHPVGGDHRRLPCRRERRQHRNARADLRDPAGIPQARSAGPGTGIRSRTSASRPQPPPDGDRAMAARQLRRCATVARRPRWNRTVDTRKIDGRCPTRPIRRSFPQTPSFGVFRALLSVTKDRCAS